EPALLKLADDAVIAEAIAPEAEFAMTKGFAERSRVVSGCYALVHVVEDFALDWRIELLEVLDGTLVVLNLPGQAGSGLARRSSACRAFRGELRPGSDLQGLRCFPRSVWWRKRFWCARSFARAARGGV